MRWKACVLAALERKNHSCAWFFHTPSDLQDNCLLRYHRILGPRVASRDPSHPLCWRNRHSQSRKSGSRQLGSGKRSRPQQLLLGHEDQTPHKQRDRPGVPPGIRPTGIARDAKEKGHDTNNKHSF